LKMRRFYAFVNSDVRADARGSAPAAKYRMADARARRLGAQSQGAPEGPVPRSVPLSSIWPRARKRRIGPGWCCWCAFLIPRSIPGSERRPSGTIAVSSRSACVQGFAGPEGSSSSQSGGIDSPGLDRVTFRVFLFIEFPNGLKHGHGNGQVQISAHLAAR